MPGVAKVIFSDHTFIRAYGLLPHPNILGGFLLVSILFTIAYNKLFHLPEMPFKNYLNKTFSLRMFHVEQNNREISWQAGVEQYEKQATKRGFLFHVEQLYSNISQFVPRGTIITIQIIALALSFSKSAWLALTIGFLYTKMAYNKPLLKLFHARLLQNIQQLFHVEHFHYLCRHYPRKEGQHFGQVKQLKQNLMQFSKLFHVEQYKNTINHVRNLFHVEQKNALVHIKMFHVEHSWVILLFFGLAVGLFWYADIYNNVTKSFSERNFYLNVSRGTIAKNPVTGIGIGQYVPSLININQILDYQYQPVHNVYLLLTSELGIFALIIFLLLIVTIWNCSTWNNSKLDVLKIYLRAILLGMLVIFLFDHYHWDIQQGSIFFWLIMGILV